ncbi:MAG: helix-turn-helix transcriptional regulator [Chloroflexi bacterium]|nr:helix-turn-helix transcriptional regulator [Chloroflexota bacterium]
MLGNRYETQVCSIARSLEQVGERWSLLIIRDAFFAGVTRYSEFQENLGIATNVLRSRLEGLVAAGIMDRRPVSDQHELNEYMLTDKGRDLAPALIALTEWGDRWATPDEPPILYGHTVCGAPVTVQVMCPTCGAVHDPTEVQARPGPGMPPAYLEARRRRRRPRPEVGPRALRLSL